MASVFKSLCRKKAKADKFLITASVSLLSIDCRKKKWHPHKLAIFWKKKKAKYSTKPIAWFGSANNIFHGDHVWPEPDPVESKLTISRNSEDNMTEYEEKNWNILVYNVSASGRHKLLATGCIDISDYVSKKLRKFDVTVTLKPAIKNVLSGKIEFELSSVIREDCPPGGSDEEIWDEIMKSASEEMIRKKSARKAQNLKSTKVAANSNGTSSRATDTTAKEARKNEAPAASPYQCNEPEVDSNDRSKVRLAEKANRGSLLFCAPTFSPPPKPCPLARQGPPQCSQETTFALCEKQLELGSLSALSTETVCKKTFVQDFEAPSNKAYSCTKKESLADSENPDIIGSTVPVKPILKCENSNSASYIEEELNLVQAELSSLKEVCSKIERELQEVESLEDSEAEWESLNQDWLTLAKFRSEVMKKKEDLLALLR